MAAMSEIDEKKEHAFNQIGEILMGLEVPGMDGFEKTGHILDVIEQLLARVISGSAINNETVDEICDESFTNIRDMAKHFLSEEKLEK